MARIIRRIIYITFVILFCITIKTFAKELILDCPENTKTGETIECNLQGNFEGNVNAIKIRYSIPEGIEMKKFVPSGDWVLITGGTPNETGLILRLNGESMEPSNETGEIDFGKFTFEVPSTYSKSTIAINIYSFDATNTACEALDFEVDSITKTIKVTDNQTENPDDEDEDEQNPPNTNPNDSEEGGTTDPGNDVNPPSDSGNNGDNTPSSTENGDNKNPSSTQGEGSAKDTANDATQGSVQDNGASENKVQGVKNDSSIVQSPMGHYGSNFTIVFIIIGMIILSIIIYAKYKKFKLIK